MFTQDHRADFDAVLKATKPFALVRFGDGEMAIMDGVQHRSADAWELKRDETSWIKAELIDSLWTDLDGFYLGLPPACCLSRGIRLRASVKAPLYRQTFATLFMHGNLPRAYEVQEHFKRAVVVHWEHGDVRIPADGVTKPWDVDGVVKRLLDVRARPILLAAGPCSNLIALRYWKRQDPHHRVPIVDVGSMIDVLHKNFNRHYHDKMNDHHCVWHEATQTKTRPGATNKNVHRVSEDRIRIGRAEPGEVEKIQRGPQRIRLGKR